MTEEAITRPLSAVRACVRVCERKHIITVIIIMKRGKGIMMRLRGESEEREAAEAGKEQQLWSLGKRADSEWLTREEQERETRGGRLSS